MNTVRKLICNNDIFPPRNREKKIDEIQYKKEKNKTTRGKSNNRMINTPL